MLDSLNMWMLDRKLVWYVGVLSLENMDISAYQTFIYAYLWICLEMFIVATVWLHHQKIETESAGSLKVQVKLLKKRPRAVTASEMKEDRHFFCDRAVNIRT